MSSSQGIFVVGKHSHHLRSPPDLSRCTPLCWLKVARPRQLKNLGTLLSNGSRRERESERHNQKRGVSWWMYIWPNYFKHWEPFHIIPSQTKGRFKSLLSFDREPHLHILQIFSFFDPTNEKSNQLYNSTSSFPIDCCLYPYFGW